MKGWQEALSKSHKRSYWFRDGDKPTWHNPTHLKGTIDRLNSERVADQKSLHKACEDIKVFLPDGFDAIVDWLFSQTAMTSEFSSILSKLLFTGNRFRDRLQQRCRNSVQMELEEEKEDYPFLRYFGYLKMFEQDRLDTLSKLVAPFLCDGIEDAPLSSAFQRLKAFSTADCRSSNELKSLITVLLQNPALSEKSREILVDVGCILSNQTPNTASLRRWCVLKVKQPVDEDLEWIFSDEKFPYLPSGSIHTVVVLLGAPKVGKSFLGCRLQHAGCPFLDVGQRLRELGLLQKSQSMFTESSRQNRRAIATHLLDEALRTYMQSLVATHPMVVTFVKSIDDAYILLDRVSKAAESTGVRCCIQALHLIRDHRAYGIFGLYPHCNDKSDESIERTRKMKWEENKVGIFEVFASKNCLFEFSVSSDHMSYNRKFPSFSVHPLVTSMDERSTIVTQVKKLLRLEKIEFMQPASFVRSEQQCRWISFPGSYQVSHKVRGTRYWLIVLQQGTSCWLLNRLGSIYKIDRVEFCMFNPSDKSCFEGLSDTVFDGILLTECGASRQFIVFDVLCFNGQITWSLSLDGRLNKLAALAPFTEVMMSSSASDNTCIYVQRNMYQPISTDNIAALLEAKAAAAIAGAVDGLIFTPTTLYTFGTSILTFKWQDLQDFKVDITQDTNIDGATNSQHFLKKRLAAEGNTLNVSSAGSAKSRTLEIVGRSYSTGCLYKCAWRNNCWNIDSLCFDKNHRVGKSDSACTDFLSIKASIELGCPLWDSQMILSAFRSLELLQHVHSESDTASSVSCTVQVK